MRAWFEEAWAIYRYHIPRVLGNGRMVLFFAACAICLPIAVRKSGEKNLRNYCVVSALYALLLLNPVLAPLYNACLGGNWWRIFWFLGVPALAADWLVNRVFVQVFPEERASRRAGEITDSPDK